MTFDHPGDHLTQHLAPSSDLPDDPVPIAASQASTPDSAPSGHFLSEIPAEPLTWLWRGRIPLGHLTLLDAAPGCGLSLFTLTVAACVSRGSPLPGDNITPPANVLLLAPYDSPSQTIRPRLEAAGADLSRILLFRLPTGDPARPLPRSFSFPADLEALATTIRRLDARLVIIDPASAIHGLTRCLPALAGIARQTNCAIVLTRSLRQVPADPLHASAPASPLLDAARSRLLLTPDPADDHRQLLITTRHSLCAKPATLSYNLQVSEADIPSLLWLGEHDDSSLAHLGSGPVHSLSRLAILRFLEQSDSPCEISDILAATDSDYEAGRKMLQRMKLAGELVSPARGLYTTSSHPCLPALTGDAPVPDVPATAAAPASPQAQPLTGDAPVPDVPTVPDTPSSLPPISIIPDSPAFVPPVPTVPNNSSPSTSPDPSGGISPPDDDL
jgi:hypothetical protein